MIIMKFRRIVTIQLVTAVAIGTIQLALTHSNGLQSGSVVADPPPTSATPTTTDGNGWGH